VLLGKKGIKRRLNWIKAQKGNGSNNWIKASSKTTKSKNANARTSSKGKKITAFYSSASKVPQQNNILKGGKKSGQSTTKSKRAGKIRIYFEVNILWRIMLFN